MEMSRIDCAIVPDCQALTFDKSMLRQNQRVTEEKQESRAGDAARLLAHRKIGARRTAWIIGAIAAAFFIASLVQGHLFHIPS
jgi:hypothetical protein